MIFWLLFAAYVIGAVMVFPRALEKMRPKWRETGDAMDAAAQIWMALIMSALWPAFGLLLLAGHALVRSRQKKTPK